MSMIAVLREPRIPVITQLGAPFRGCVRAEVNYRNGAKEHGDMWRYPEGIT